MPLLVCIILCQRSLLTPPKKRNNKKTYDWAHVPKNVSLEVSASIIIHRSL